MRAIAHIAYSHSRNAASGPSKAGKSWKAGLLPAPGNSVGLAFADRDKRLILSANGFMVRAWEATKRCAS